MNNSIINLNLSATNKEGTKTYYTHLYSPAKDYEIRDALEKIRMISLDNMQMDVEVSYCKHIFEINKMQLDRKDINELNFLAHRIEGLNEIETKAFEAVVAKLRIEKKGQTISVKDFINCTYGLDKVKVIPNVFSYKEIGKMAMENDLLDFIKDVPENARHMLDTVAIGKELVKSEKGALVNGDYIVTTDYVMPEVYDGQTLPYTVGETDWIFRLLVAKAPADENDNTSNCAEWVELPIDNNEIQSIAERHGVSNIGDCVYYDFESAVPQIESDVFNSMSDIKKLNSLASKLKYHAPFDMMKFKAILQAEKPKTIADMIKISDEVWRYQLNSTVERATDFYKSYVKHYLDKRFDTNWINFEVTNIKECEMLLDKLGASVTDYGVISARGRSLYEIVPFKDAEPTENIVSQTDESTGITMGGMNL